MQNSVLCTSFHPKNSFWLYSICPLTCLFADPFPYFLLYHALIHTHTLSLPKALLDDLDKELNNYIMRCREWYGWHFPEMGKIVTDNLTYAKTVKAIGQRAVICVEGKY